jgi:hypothetical protein
MLASHGPWLRAALIVAGEVALVQHTTALPIRKATLADC